MFQQARGKRKNTKPIIRKLITDFTIARVRTVRYKFFLKFDHARAYVRIFLYVRMYVKLWHMKCSCARLSKKMAK